MFRWFSNFLNFCQKFWWANASLQKLSYSWKWSKIIIALRNVLNTYYLKAGIAHRLLPISQKLQQTRIANNWCWKFLRRRTRWKNQARIIIYCHSPHLDISSNINQKMSEKRIIRRRRAGSTGSDSDEEVVLSGASQEDGVSYDDNFFAKSHFATSSSSHQHETTFFF